MDFMEISKMRRSVRKFAQTPVSDELIEKILEAGRWAPTAANGQPQRILVLNTEEKLSKVKDACTVPMPGKDTQTMVSFYYGSPVVLLVCYDETACWHHPQGGKSSGLTDATIVTTHMMLEAASLGLGTVWVSFFDEEKAKSLLALPDSWQPVCMLNVGYPADAEGQGSTGASRRKPLNETCFYNEV